MSIPPLVCSTPPPPDQCEDYKEPDDFELRYDSSQEYNESNDYNYGIFSSYSDFQSTSSEDKEVVPKFSHDMINENQDIELPNENFSTTHNCKTSISKIRDEDSTDIELIRNNNISAKKIVDEDTNLEDLNLQISHVPIEIPDKIFENSEVIKQDINIIAEKSDITQEDFNSIDESALSDNDVKADVKLTDAIECSISHSNHEELENDKEGISINTTTVEEFSSNFNNSLENIKTAMDPLDVSVISNEIENDDFEEFGSFQFQNIDTTSDTLDINEDPWKSEKSDNTNNNEFKANFEENADFGIVSLPKNETNISCVTLESNQNDLDDEFGDFDDFKSCENESKSDQLQPVINLSVDNENQLLESINNVLYTIFEEEILDTKDEYGPTLESSLSVIWGHLIETDVRQPYVINWNSTLGQKNLLKALSIDSRNILFGPKWSNMPKYATNLNSAPLQPLKPLSPTVSSPNETTTSDNNLNKIQDSWPHPSSLGGQESCSNAGNEKTTTETVVTGHDLYDTFKMPTKPETIFIPSVNVESVRQISLPDTHIFTPTDSETPRSKTIHYDSGPPVLISHNAAVTFPQKHNQQINHKPTDTSYGIDEFSEFGEFKSSNIFENKLKDPIDNKSEEKNVDANPQNLLPHVNIGLQTGILQPFKVEPMFPTVNWPDPGEVKEISEDFSDFLSNPREEDKQNVINIPKLNIQDIKPVISTSNNIDNLIVKDIVQHQPSESAFDDDFDTFKCALPVQNTSVVVEAAGSCNTNFSKSEIFTSLSISNQSSNHNFSTLTNNLDVASSSNWRPVDALNSDDGKITSNTKKITQTQSLGRTQIDTVLKPMQTKTSTLIPTQPNTGQILEPLSLESFSQINWPNPGIDLQDLSRFNPVETLHSLKTDLSANSQSKNASPAHNQKQSMQNHILDDDIWGEFVSSKPKPQQVSPKKDHVEDDEWNDFVSSPSVKPQNGLNTISLNVHTNLNMQKFTNFNKSSSSPAPMDIPSLNYITPKSSNHTSYNDRHFQNL